MRDIKARTVVCELEKAIAQRTNAEMKLREYRQGNQTLVVLESISVPAEMRRQGAGSAAMPLLCQTADRRSWVLELQPDSCFGTPELVLRAWYHGYGFRNTSSGDGPMRRQPKSDY
ncbi:hypothetical protein GCM10025777_39460 [Membranihabitans marinus]